MDLLFLNAIKGLKTKKIQMLGIIFCIMLSTGIFTAMNIALDRMEDRYHNYLKEQNIEDFSFVPKIDLFTEYTKEEIEVLKQNELKDIPKEQMDIINMYQMTLGSSNIPNKDKIYSAVEMILNNTGASFNKAKQNIKISEEKYDFTSSIETSKIATNDKYLYKAIVYEQNKKVNIPYLVEGKMPVNNDEITVLKGFAKKNNIKINDCYKIGDKEYKIVGFAYSPEHILPIISFNRPIYNEKTDTIIYMNMNTFNEFSGIKEVVYVGSFNDKNKTNSMEELMEIFKEEESISLSPMAAIRIMRVNTLEMEITISRLFAKYFLYLLLGISVFIILVITKKRIEDERLQIGVLKALGYKSTGISLSYLVYPIIGSLIGGIIGYVSGLFLHNFLTKLYLGYYNMPILGFQIDLKYLAISVLMPMIILSILAFLIAMFMLRKKPLQLLKEGSNLKVNLFSKIVSFLTRKLPFKSRFRYSLASRSLSKLLIVTITSFCIGLLIVLILIGVNMFSSMINKTFVGLNFDNMVSYISTQYGSSSSEDLIYDDTFKLDSIQKEGVITKIKRKKDFNVTMSGIDKKLNLMEIRNKKGEDISNKLVDKNDVIINSNIAEIIDAKIGDTLIFTKENKEYKYKIVGILDSFMGSQIYLNKLGLDVKENAYNKKFTCDNKYSNISMLDEKELSSIASIFSVSDLKENMTKQIQTSNASIYFVIGFASIMALVIILVIANVIVEENKKTISLMKVMGYKSKSISSIVLNIYTPFVIIAYLLAIPAMKSILLSIVNILTKDMSYAIPIEFSIVKAIIGLIGLLIGYYLAIFISRKTLNKIPLSVALKRE
ncbi:MAG: ABC transporter permease [Clostridia bacterium]